MAFTNSAACAVFQRGPEVGVGGILAAPEQVGADGAAKQLGFLHHDCHTAAQSRAGVLLRRTAQDLHGALRGIIEAGDQVDEAGFAAARAADDTNGLAALCGKTDIGQAGGTGTGVGQADMVEPDSVPGPCLQVPRP